MQDQLANNKAVKVVVNQGVLYVITDKTIKDVVIGDLTAKTLAQSISKEINVSQFKARDSFTRVAHTDGSFSTIKFVIK